MPNYEMRTPRPGQLFDPDPPKCLACGATNPHDCHHNHNREHGTASITRRRPKTCVAAYDPRTAEIPF